MRKKILLSSLALMLLVFLSGCGNQSDLAPVAPIEETYEYTTTARVYAHPAVLTVERRVEYLSLTIDDGFFFCATTDSKEADVFVNAQRTLLQFLRESGTETPKLNYFAMDTDDSFSESEKKRAHISLSDTKSYRQVLITLQTLWGDYTDYGYLYALANAIAAHLGWQTDAAEEVEQAVLDSFFADHPAALNLLYPCFTTTFASEETVHNCKALSTKLLEKIDLRTALTKPIDEQVNDFRALVDAYAQEISVSFSRQDSGYAYYGEYIPLKISTTYALHMIESGYDDKDRAWLEELGDETWDYFSDYRSIFETLDIINAEIARSVQYFGLEDDVGLVVVNWVCPETSTELWGKPNKSYYKGGYDDSLFDGRIYLRAIAPYLHEYFHHIDHVISHDLNQTWQEQAFSELGSVQSQHARHVHEWMTMHEDAWIRLFNECFGREYQPGLDDYYNTYDLLCYMNSYELDYNNGGAAVNSITRYLLDLYGEETVLQILLFTDTVETVTGKTWDELESDWRQYMDEKSENIVIPDWVYE